MMLREKKGNFGLDFSEPRRAPMYQSDPVKRPTKTRAPPLSQRITSAENARRRAIGPEQI